MALQNIKKGSGRSILSDGLLGKSERLKASNIEQDLMALGVSEEEAKTIMSLPEKIQSDIIQSIVSGYNQQQEPQDQQQGPLGMASGTLQGMLPSWQTQKTPQYKYQDPYQAPEQAPQDPYQLQQDPYQVPESTTLQGLAPAAPTEQQQYTMDQEPTEQEASLSPEEQLDTLNDAWTGGMSPEMQLKEEARQEKQEFEKQKFKALLDEKEETRRDKIEEQSKKYFTDINQRSKNAYEMDMRLGRMAELVRNDDLGIPLLNSVFDLLDKGIHGAVNISLNVDSLRTADAQEFNKLSKEFLKGAKLIFGARLTDADVRYFLKMVPSLVQSQEGKMRIISNLMIMTEADQVRKKHMDDLIEENGGYRPRGLEASVEKRASKELKELSKEFKSTYQRFKLSEKQQKAEDRPFIAKVIEGTGELISGQAEALRGRYGKYFEPSITSPFDTVKSLYSLLGKK